VSRSSMPQVEGPLQGYARGFSRELLEQGYTRASAARHLRVMAQLSSWLGAQGLGAEALTWHRAGAFVSERRAVGCRARLSLGPLLDYLHGIGAAPPLSAAATPTERLLAAYGAYLAGERSLADPASRPTWGWPGGS